MRKIDQEAKYVLHKILCFVAPAAMKASERAQLARAAGINPDTLRHLLKRESLHADTLIRLLLARGVSAKAITNLPQTEFSELKPGEARWIEYGRALTEVEKIEFVEIVDYIRQKWSRLERK